MGSECAPTAMKSSNTLVILDLNPPGGVCTETSERHYYYYYFLKLS